MDLDSHTVREAALTVGIDLDETEATDLARSARSLARVLVDEPPPVDESPPATDVREGTDRYGAFRYRFRTAAGEGPLSGVTVAVKDNIAVAGVPMTCGSATFECTPRTDATVVRRLRESGADVVGTTNMDEFALSTTGETCAHGATDNPVLRDRVPGGSSSGSGAAVSGGLADAALGSDTGGSVRIPASFCGVVGLKPTHRTVPRYGFADLSPTADAIGPIAGSVRLAGEAFDAISGADLADPSTHVTPSPPEVSDSIRDSPSGLRVGVIEETLDASDPAVAEGVKDALAGLESAGVTVTYRSLPEFADAVRILEGITGPEFALLVRGNGHSYGIGTGCDETFRRAMADTLNADGFGPNVREQVLINLAILAATGGQSYVRSQGARRSFTGTVRDHLDAVDALVTPATPTTAPRRGELATRAEFRRLASHTAPFNLTGGAAVSVPIETADGRPVGLQIGGGCHAEPTLLSLAAAVEGSGTQA